MSEIMEFSVESIKNFLIKKIQENKDFLFNELELQVFLVRELEKELTPQKYRVYLEYQLPKGWNEKFDKEYERWGTEKPCFDIVIEECKNKKFVAIELKYKLKKVKLNQGDNLMRFGEESNERGIALVTNQSAENEGRYDFWKDVKRLEILNESFSNVIGGIAIIVTNQGSYKNNNPNNKSSKFNFDKEKSGFLYWDWTNKDKKKEKCKELNCGENCQETPCGEKLRPLPKEIKKEEDRDWGSRWHHYERPNFKLKKSYIGNWYDTQKIMGQEFYCFAVEVTKS